MPEPRRVDEIGEEDGHVLPHLARDRMRACLDEHVRLSALAQLERPFERAAGAVADDDVTGLRKADEPRRRSDRSAHDQGVAADDHLAALQCHP